jgi:hypothetical protein
MIIDEIDIADCASLKREDDPQSYWQHPEEPKSDLFFSADQASHPSGCHLQKASTTLCGGMTRSSACPTLFYITASFHM